MDNVSITVNYPTEKERSEELLLDNTFIYLNLTKIKIKNCLSSLVQSFWEGKKNNKWSWSLLQNNIFATLLKNTNREIQIVILFTIAGINSKPNPLQLHKFG